MKSVLSALFVSFLSFSVSAEIGINPVAGRVKPEPRVIGINPVAGRVKPEPRVIGTNPVRSPRDAANSQRSSRVSIPKELNQTIRFILASAEFSEESSKKLSESLKKIVRNELKLENDQLFIEWLSDMKTVLAANQPEVDAMSESKRAEYLSNARLTIELAVGQEISRLGSN